MNGGLERTSGTIQVTVGATHEGGGTAGDSMISIGEVGCGISDAQKVSEILDGGKEKDDNIKGNNNKHLRKGFSFKDP